MIADLLNLNELSRKTLLLIQNFTPDIYYTNIKKTNASSLYQRLDNIYMRK